RTMPTCSPLGPTSRTSGTRIRSLMRGSALMPSSRQIDGVCPVDHAAKRTRLRDTCSRSLTHRRRGIFRSAPTRSAVADALTWVPDDLDGRCGWAWPRLLAAWPDGSDTADRSVDTYITPTRCRGHLRPWPHGISAAENGE